MEYSAFIERLEQLCREYGVVIAACGCCDSPWIERHEWKPEERLKVDQYGRKLMESVDSE